jgi:hypothetical protein
MHACCYTRKRRVSEKWNDQRKERLSKKGRDYHPKFFPFGFQCHRYRLRFDQIARNRMREKVTASIIFKDRKASYKKR